MGRVNIEGRDFKIAKIIDEYSVVINGGSDAGIAPGDTFEIFEPGSPIIDPDTRAPLGYLDYIKAKIVAKDVFDRMSVCVSKDQMSSFVANLAAGMIMRPAELNVAAEDISGGYDDCDEKIRVGDRVRKIVHVDKPSRDSNQE